MRRLILIPLALLGLYAGASVAAVARPSGRDVETIVSIGSRSLTFVRHHHERSCALRAHSPSMAGFAPGDVVRITCSRRHVLVRVVSVPSRHRRRGTTTTTTTTPTSTSTTTQTTTDPTTVSTPTTTTGGTVTSSNAPLAALSATSITVGSLTCQIGPSSPSTSGFKVGDVVLISCTGGTLTLIELDSF